MYKVFNNIRHIENTSSSSIPICLEQLLKERKSDELLGLSAFGSGFTYGGAILRMIKGLAFTKNTKNVLLQHSAIIKPFKRRKK